MEAGWGQGSSSVIFKIKLCFFVHCSPPHPSGPVSFPESLPFPQALCSEQQSVKNLDSPTVLFTYLPPTTPSPTRRPHPYTSSSQGQAFPASIQTQLQETCRKRLPSGLESSRGGEGGGMREDTLPWLLQEGRGCHRGALNFPFPDASVSSQGLGIGALI